MYNSKENEVDRETEIFRFKVMPDLDNFWKIICILKSEFSYLSVPNTLESLCAQFTEECFDFKTELT